MGKEGSHPCAGRAVVASNIGGCLWGAQAAELSLSSPPLAFLEVLFHIVASFLSTCGGTVSSRISRGCGRVARQRAPEPDLRVLTETNQENREFKRACAFLSKRLCNRGQKGREPVILAGSILESRPFWRFWCLCKEIYYFP